MSTPDSLTTLPCPHRRELLITLGLTIGLFGPCVLPGMLGRAAAQPPTESVDSLLDGKPVDYWIEQLSAKSFAQRERATFLLSRAGTEVFGPLVRASHDGDLERTSRTIRILRDAADAQDVAATGGAIGLLEQMASDSVGARGVAASEALQSIWHQRARRAAVVLMESGVSLKPDRLMPTAMQATPMIRIDENWNGDLEPLKWLRWHRGIYAVRLSGPACSDEVLVEVAKMKHLRVLSMEDGTLSEAGLEQLTALDQLSFLNFNYVTFEGTPEDVLVRMPMVETLRIFGTNLSDDGADQVRLAFRSSTIEIGRGGFLGVESALAAPNCVIKRVIPGGAAAKAGLRDGDVIVEVNGIEIEDFPGLKKQIGKLPPGKELKITAERPDLTQPFAHPETIQVTAKLQRMAVE